MSELDQIKAEYEKIFGTKLAYNRSVANKGVMGQLNKYQRWKNNRKFEKDRKDPNKIVVIGEGDSWLNYPIFVNAIGNYFRDDKDFAFYNIASAGDWLSNMIEDNTYIDKIAEINPKYFFLSAGGNDLISGDRINFLINSQKNSIKNGYLNENFYLFLNVLRKEFKIIFDMVERVSASTTIVMHGYGYCLPCYNKNFVPKLLGNGKWLCNPLLKKGYDKETSQYVLISIINEFNTMIKELCVNEGVKFIDLRSAAYTWYDEIHHDSAGFKKCYSLIKSNLK